MFRHVHFLWVALAFTFGVLLLSFAYSVLLGGVLGGRSMLHLFVTRLPLLLLAVIIGLVIAYTVSRIRGHINLWAFALAAFVASLIGWMPTLFTMMNVLPHIGESSSERAVAAGKVVGVFVAHSLPFVVGWFASWLVVLTLPKPPKKIDPDVF